MYVPGINRWRPTADANELGVRRPLRQRALSRALSATPRVLTYSTRDVIDNRISIPAQHSLVRLSKNAATSGDAVGILEEIKAGRLGGIFCVNWKTPAQRALRIGHSWWTVIPKSEDAVLMLDPDNPLRGQPLIAFRRELDPDCGLLQGEKRFAASPARLDAALLKAWASYKLLKSSGELNKCVVAPTGGIVAEIGGPGSARPLTNVMPPVSCQGGAAPSCFTTVPDSTLSLLLTSPVRDLTKEQARDVVLLLVGARLVTIQPPPTFDAACNVLRPRPTDLVNIRPAVIDGVTIVNAGDPRVKTVNAVDLRMVVLLFNLARFLRLTWGVTEIHHSCIGSSGTHKGRLALDFSGVAGDVPPGRTSFGVSLSGPFKISVLNDWGQKSVQLPDGSSGRQWPAGTKDKPFRNTAYRLDPVQNRFVNTQDRNSLLAFPVFRDIYSFATFHCTDRTDPGAKSCKGRHTQTTPTTIGSSSQCIVHPDHPNPTLRFPAHVNHIHMEIPL